MFLSLSLSLFVSVDTGREVASCCCGMQPSVLSCQSDAVSDLACFLDYLVCVCAHIVYVHLYFIMYVSSGWGPIYRLISPSRVGALYTGSRSQPRPQCHSLLGAPHPGAVNSGRGPQPQVGALQFRPSLVSNCCGCAVCGVCVL